MKKKSRGLRSQKVVIVEKEVDGIVIDDIGSISSISKCNIAN